ncbi:MAG: CPBP family glutamic-type intramembrane protease [Promethearchaeia archaeon]
MNQNKDDNLGKKSPEQSKKDVVGEKVEEKWEFCPNCGAKLPKIENLRFCINCGTDLQYIKNHKKVPAAGPKNPYKNAQEHPQTQKYVPSQQYSQPQSYIYDYSERQEKIEEENIETTDKKLWGISASIGIPLLAFIVMNLAVVGVMVIVTLFIYDLEVLYNLLTSPIFIICTSIVELILIIFPLYYAGNYLKNPTLTNRFRLLGLSTKRLANIGIVKELAIGLFFAVVGIFLVGFVSLATEYLLEIFFDIQIVAAEEVPTNDIDLVISSADLFTIILLAVIMIGVVGPSEEILFRGFMQKGLVKQLGDKAGVLITAFIFALIHLITLVFMPMSSPFTFFILFILMFMPYFAISLMLGLIFRWRDQNLIAVIICHGLYNSFTVIFAFIFSGLLI